MRPDRRFCPALLSTQGMHVPDGPPRVWGRSAIETCLASIGRVALGECSASRLVRNAVAMIIGGMIAGWLHMALVALIPLSSSSSPLAMVEIGARTWLFTTAALWIGRLLVRPSVLGAWRVASRRHRLRQLLAIRSCRCRIVAADLEPRLAS
ncbi:MAG: hypothetical protein U1E76_18725 [Planctomycetota bacterium]